MKKAFGELEIISSAASAFLPAKLKQEACRPSEVVAVIVKKMWYTFFKVYRAFFQPLKIEGVRLTYVVMTRCMGILGAKITCGTL